MRCTRLRAIIHRRVAKKDRSVLSYIYFCRKESRIKKQVISVARRAAAADHTLAQRSRQWFSADAT